MTRREAKEEKSSAPKAFETFPRIKEGNKNVIATMKISEEDRDFAIFPSESPKIYKSCFISPHYKLPI
jgi:hypothetical protein